MRDIYLDKPTKELIFVFSEKAANKYGPHMALNEAGQPFSYTAAFRPENTVYCDWGDEQEVVTMVVPLDHEVRQIAEHGQLVNQDKYAQWGILPKMP